MVILKTDGTTQTIISRLSGMYPSAIESYYMTEGKSDKVQRLGSTFYGFVYSGKFVVNSLNEEIFSRVRHGAFFAINNEVKFECVENGVIIFIERLGYQAMQICGAIEKIGRLTYIDDCSDSLLCPPARLGDPCLNHLHFPSDILQAQHTHPSIRLGIVAKGCGVAWGPGFSKPLTAGDIFCLDEGERHSFKTGSETMDIIAFHPDSDWGPTDTQHPMLNRTYLVSKNRYDIQD